MNKVIETIKYKGYNINICPDYGDESPREWENLGTIICVFIEDIILVINMN
jgi:hypothetical protein